MHGSRAINMWRHHPIFNWLFGYEIQRKRAFLQAPKGPLKDFLSVASPSLNTPLSELDILTVDFETTGLDAVNDKLLSVGFCQLSQGQIQLGSSYHQIINTQQKLKADNVVIHQITDQQQQQGKPLQEVVEQLLAALAGKVMLVHYNSIERKFLQQACLELYGLKVPLLMIDTLVLAKRRLDLRDVAYDPSELRLPALRAHFQLPPYFAHNALNDAIATAELFLAETSQNSPNANLRDLVV